MATAAVLKSQPEHEFSMQGKGKAVFRFSGVVFERKYSFLEYVFGGCDINLNIAVDFTLSNGHPSNQDSLHYFDPNRNQYLQVI